MVKCPVFGSSIFLESLRSLGSTHVWTLKSSLKTLSHRFVRATFGHMTVAQHRICIFVVRGYF